MSTAFSKPAFSKLTQAEAVNLDNYEHEIQTHYESFIKVGNALVAIKEDRLYRANYPTFEAYLEDRWKIKRTRAYALIAAAKVANAVSEVSDIKPRESHAAELAELPEEEQADAWKESLDTAPNGKPTAAHVAAVVAKRKKPKPRPEREAVEIDDEPAPAEPNTIGEMFARYDSFVAELTNEQPPHVVLALKEHSAGVWAALG